MALAPVPTVRSVRRRTSASPAADPAPPSTRTLGSTSPDALSSRPGHQDARGDIVALQQKIAARISHGRSLADVRREIIGPSPLSEDQRTALWLYAASQPAVLQTATPLSRFRRPDVR